MLTSEPRPFGGGKSSGRGRRRVRHTRRPHAEIQRRPHQRVPGRKGRSSGLWRRWSTLEACPTQSHVFGTLIKNSADFGTFRKGLITASAHRPHTDLGTTCPGRAPRVRSREWLDLLWFAMMRPPSTGWDAQYAKLTNVVPGLLRQGNASADRGAFSLSSRVCRLTLSQEQPPPSQDYCTSAGHQPEPNDRRHHYVQ